MQLTQAEINAEAQAYAANPAFRLEMANGMAVTLIGAEMPRDQLEAHAADMLKHLQADDRLSLPE